MTFSKTKISSTCPLPCPYGTAQLTPASAIFQHQTDINEFPYPRFYRGQALNPKPIVWEREAGISTLLKPSPLVYSSPSVDASSLYCFEAPCNTTFPCTSRKRYSMPTNPVEISP